MYDILNLLFVYLLEKDIKNIYIENVKEADLYNYTLHILSLGDVENIQTFYDNEESESKIVTVELEVYDTDRKNLIKSVKELKKIFKNMRITGTKEELKHLDVESAYLENEIYDREIVKKDIIEYRAILVFNLFVNEKI